jgi:hypothetical protein
VWERERSQTFFLLLSFSFFLSFFLSPHYSHSPAQPISKFSDTCLGNTEMESTRENRLWRTKQKYKQRKADLDAVLRKSWYHLRLSVRHPSRVPTWDAIVLTAASPEQAQLYDWQLERAKRIGRVSPSTVTLAVPDPHGQRIGSGAATLHAIHALAAHYQHLGLHLAPKVRNFGCVLLLVLWLVFV